MYTDNRILPSSHGSLSGGLLSSRCAETFGLPRRLNRALGLLPLHGDLDQAGGIKRLFGFHDFKPSFDGLCDVGNRLFACLSLRETAWKRGDFGNIITGFILFYQDMQFHNSSFSDG